jgi:hypothetical protein
MAQTNMMCIFTTHAPCSCQNTTASAQALLVSGEADDENFVNRATHPRSFHYLCFDNTPPYWDRLGLGGRIPPHHHGSCSPTLDAQQFGFSSSRSESTLPPHSHATVQGSSLSLWTPLSKITIIFHTPNSSLLDESNSLLLYLPSPPRRQLRLVTSVRHYPSSQKRGEHACPPTPAILTVHRPPSPISPPLAQAFTVSRCTLLSAYLVRENQEHQVNNLSCSLSISTTRTFKYLRLGI